jgi:hypothetical protein
MRNLSRIEIPLTGIDTNRYTAVGRTPAAVGGICMKKRRGAYRESMDATTKSVAFCGAYWADGIM